jgi:hypothetical protein
MFKPQMMEAIFVAGSVLAGMTGSILPKVVIALCPMNRVEVPIHWRVVDPRSLRNPVGSVESLSRIHLYR